MMTIKRSKICTKCRIEKDVNEYYKNKKAIDGLYKICKHCHNMATKLYYETNKEMVLEKCKGYRDRNKDRRKESGKIYREKHKNIIKTKGKEYRKTKDYEIKQNKYKEEHKKEIKERRKIYYKKNKTKILEYQRKYRSENKGKISARNARYQKRDDIKIRDNGKRRERRKNPLFRLSHNVSSSILQALKKNKNGHRWEKLVGYTLIDLKKHLEKLFKPGMGWDNYGLGKDKWGIDHIIPRARYNFQKETDIDFKKCWALKNLQPMWNIENCAKGKKIDKPFQPSLQLSIE